MGSHTRRQYIRLQTPRPLALRRHALLRVALLVLALILLELLLLEQNPHHNQNHFPHHQHLNVLARQ